MVVSHRCRLCAAPLAQDARDCTTCGSRLLGAAALERASVPVRWHADPVGRAHDRLWNGERWSDEVWRHGAAGGLDVSAPAPPAIFVRGSGARLLALTLAGLVAAFVLSILFDLGDVAIGRPGGSLGELCISEAGLWTGFVATCVLASRRFGSGRLRTDYHLTIRPIDPAIGLGGALAGHCLSAAILVAVAAVHHETANPDQPLFKAVTEPALGWFVLVVITCIGAPIVEELFFRGLLQGQLVQRFGPGVGVTVTAIVFGAAHVLNAPGIEGVIYGIGILGGGIALGVVRQLTGRLGASMTTHALFNAMALAAFAASLH